MLLCVAMILSVFAIGTYSASAENTDTVLLEKGSTWTYGWTKVDEQFPDGWYGSQFDVSAWPKENAPFKQTSAVLLKNVVRAAFIKNVEVADLSAVESLTMTIRYGENPVIYLNGEELWSAQGSNTQTFVTVDLSDKKDLLVQGWNRLAVYMENQTNNFCFDMSLTTTLENGETATLVTPGDAWVYGWTWLDEQFPEGWYGSQFDVTGWPVGYCPFEFNSDTILSGVRRAAFIQEFEVEDLSEIGALIMEIYYDENPVIYLNGVEAWSATGYTTTDFLEVDLSNKKDLLVEGTNRVSVYMENLSGNFYFDMSLTAKAPAEEQDVVKFEGYQMGNDGNSIRFIGSVSDLNYESVDLQIKVTGDCEKAFGCPTTRVFKTLNSTDGPVATTIGSNVEASLVLDADYLFGYAITGIEAGTYMFEIVPVATTYDGQTVQGKTATLTITID